MAFRPEDWLRLKRIAEGNPGKENKLCMTFVTLLKSDHTYQMNKRLVRSVLDSIHFSRFVRTHCKYLTKKEEPC